MHHVHQHESTETLSWVMLSHLFDMKWLSRCLRAAIVLCLTRVRLFFCPFCRRRNSFHESLKQIGSVQQQGGGGGVGTYETMQHLNDIKEHLHLVKRDTEHLVQRNAQVGIRVWNLYKNGIPEGKPRCWRCLWFHHADWILLRLFVLWCEEPRRQSCEVSWAASHALLFIHRPFCHVRGHPNRPVLLLRHVQVRRHRHFYAANTSAPQWILYLLSFFTSVSHTEANKKQQQRSSFDEAHRWDVSVNEGMSILVIFCLIISDCKLLYLKNLVFVKKLVLINCRFNLIWCV